VSGGLEGEDASAGRLRSQQPGSQEEILKARTRMGNAKPGESPSLGSADDGLMLVSSQVKPHDDILRFEA
jgi:hypothetical protein